MPAVAAFNMSCRNGPASGVLRMFSGPDQAGSIQADDESARGIAILRAVASSTRVRSARRLVVLRVVRQVG